jgi:hypothetical protein
MYISYECFVHEKQSLFTAETLLIILDHCTNTVSKINKSIGWIVEAS